MTRSWGPRDSLIIDATRSPIGRAFKGSLIEVRPDDLGAHVVRTLMARNPSIPLDAVDDVVCGVSGATGEQAFNLGRAVALLAGLPPTVPGTSVNRFCASSLQAARMAHHAIRADEGDLFVVVGVESVSRRGVAATEADHNPRFVDDDRADFVNRLYIGMGETAENVAERYGVSRADQDAFAERSHRLAVAAQADGTTAREITPIPLPTGGLMEQDDGPRPGTSVEILSGLRTVFRENGTVTAGNSCSLNDGAAAMVFSSGARADALDLDPVARVVATAVTGLEPEMMGVGPIEATRRALAAASLGITDIDVVEVNEAFAAQVLPVCDELGFDIDRQVNPAGGSIALGHPFGMTGVRLVTTLLNGLRARDGQFGLATLCIGGGQGMAMIIERLQ